ncbi:MarR family transcriptional regulator [Ramlibacter sp. G-1-2-2]|uniref:MarR family transcriptional regulator n=1 Tax=Ramlibacter agri TaxID=2728837 RepID=A0A848H3H2_9BURK|nr:MarR family transcriptional regulator [Ramlibacter agri]NML45047.1 MarR family transcriptional regulator [Ramlibacter agri]
MSVANSRAAALMQFTGGLATLQRAYRAAADRAVAHLGISHALAWPLLSIGRLGGGVRPGVVAESLGIEAASVVRSIEQLVQAGLAERQDDPADGRAKTLHLTDAGHEAWEQIEAALDALRAELFAGLPDADIAACLRVFGTLSDRLGSPVPELPAKPKRRKARA